MFADFFHQGRTSRLRADIWLPELLRLGFEGVIFDCDGTLVDSSEAHRLCMQDAASQQGYQMDADWFFARTGLDRASLLVAFRSDVGPDFDVTRAMDVSIASYARYVGLVKPISETNSFLRDLKKRGLPYCVATNAEHDVALQSLALLALVRMWM